MQNLDLTEAAKKKLEESQARYSVEIPKHRRSRTHKDPHIRLLLYLAEPDFPLLVSNIEVAMPITAIISKIRTG
jgi:hypothetical protein